MPDTMIPSTEIAAPPSGAGVMAGYRSASIGKLVSARAKASAKIKAIVKDKQAKVESRKEGGRSYSYQYADLSDVLEAIEEAISEQGLAIFQTTQDRGREGTYLITTLAHESDQWIAAEIRLKSADQGPQVYGSEMTYMRRYAVLAALALAPERDDDGATAQDRTDQQSRQKPVQAAPQSRHPIPASPPRRPTQESQAADDEQEHTPIATGRDGPLYGRWTAAALETLAGKPEAWRRNWLALHEDEMEELRSVRSDYADRIDSAAIAPDLPAGVAA